MLPTEYYMLPVVIGLAYVLNKGKITFETDKCLNVAFVNDEVRCLIQNGGVFEYYDIMCLRRVTCIHH